MLGDPDSGSTVWKAPDREIGKPGENRGKVLAHRDLQPTAAFHDRENRCNLRSCQWAAGTGGVGGQEIAEAARTELWAGRGAAGALALVFGDLGLVWQPSPRLSPTKVQSGPGLTSTR